MPDRPTNGVLFKARGLVISVVFREAGQKLLGALLLRVVDDLLGIALFHDEAAVHEDHLIRHVPGEAEEIPLMLDIIE